MRKRLEAEERARVAPLRAQIQRLDQQINQLGARAAALELLLRIRSCMRQASAAP